MTLLRKDLEDELAWARTQASREQQHEEELLRRAAAESAAAGPTGVESK